MVVSLLFGLSAIVSWDRATAELSPDPAVRCGVDCLYLVFSQFDVAVPPYKEFLERFVVSDKGSSMESLQNAANEFGLGSLAVRLKDDQLKAVLNYSEFPIIAICHLERGHYVLAYRSTVDEFIMVDSSKKKRVVADEIMWPDKFSGNCLLLATQPLSVAQVQAWSEMGHKTHPVSFLLWGACGFTVFFLGRQLRSQQERLTAACRVSKEMKTASFLLLLIIMAFSVGCSYQDSAQEDVMIAEVGDSTTIELDSLYYDSDDSAPSFQVTLRNSSDRHIPITGITSSCGCSNAKVLGESISPESEIPLVVRMSKGMAEKRVLFFAVNHGEEFPQTKIRVEGSFFDSCYVEPSFVRFGSVNDSETSRCAFAYFHLTSPSQTAPDLKVESDGLGIVEVASTELRSTQRMNGRVAAFRHTFRTKLCVTAKVLEGNSGDGSALITYSIGNERKRFLNVSWSLEQYLACAPSRLVFENRDEQQALVLSSRNHHPFSISNAEMDPDATTGSFIVHYDGASDAQQTVQVRCDDKDGLLSDAGEAILAIEIGLPYDKTIQVPVSWRFSAIQE